MEKTKLQHVKIGILQSGRLINEIVIDDPRNVSIGTSLESTITIDEENFPETTPFLEYSNGKYYLVILKEATGSLFDGDNTISLSPGDVKNNPDVISLGRHHAIPLSSNVRGMMMLRKNTILFKVYLSEPVPKELPPEFRGSLLTRNLDVPFATILSLFFIGYLVLTYSFSKVKYVEDIEFEHIPEKFARLIMDNPNLVKKEKPKETKIVKKEESKDTKKKNETKPTPPPKKSITSIVGTTKQMAGVKTGKNPSEVVRSAGIIGIIGSKGRGGTVANLFQQGGFEQKLDKALKGVSGLYVTKTAEEAKMKRGSLEGKGLDVGSLKTTTGSGLVAFGTNNASAANIIGKIGEKDIEGEGKMNPSVIAKVLSQHVSAFQYCYNKALQGNPKLSGELKVRFIIKQNGVVDGGALEFGGTASRDTSLTSCVQRVFSRIKFPSPKGGEVVVNYPLNFMAQN